MNEIDDITLDYYTNLSSPLLEDTRQQLISASKQAGVYQHDQTRGKNRFERKRFSKLIYQSKTLNKIDMNKFFKQDLLEFKLQVAGETDTYIVSVRLNGVLNEIAEIIKKNKGILVFATVLKALIKTFNTTNVYISCTCDDFLYRFKHWSIINNYGFDDSSSDPGSGKNLANPLNDKGKGCKHILLVLGNQDWIMKVTSVLYNYIQYAETSLVDPFKKIIFPKLYGVTIEQAAENNLVSSDTDLNKTKNIITTINNWGKLK